MRNFYLLTFIFIASHLLYAQEEDTKQKQGRFEISYATVGAFEVYSSSVPDETFHTSPFFSRDFPFIHPDEPDNYISLRYIFNTNNENKWSTAIAIDYLHTKPNRFDSGAGDLNGLYLANGYTQLGLGVGLYYNLSKRIILNTLFSTGPMLSNPNWDGKEYISYKNLTPFLPHSYQITGWGFTNTLAADILFGNHFAITGTFILHYDESKKLRATDGTSASFHSFIHSFGIGFKIRL